MRLGFLRCQQSWRSASLHKNVECAEQERDQRNDFPGNSILRYGEIHFQSADTLCLHEKGSFFVEGHGGRVPVGKNPPAWIEKGLDHQRSVGRAIESHNAMLRLPSGRLERAAWCA